MVTEANQAEVEVQDAPSADEANTESQEGAEDTAINWEARNEESQKEIAKLKNDAHSQTVNLLKQVERDEMFVDVRDTVSMLAKSQEAYMKALASGETENLPQELGQIQSDAAVTRAKTSYEARYNSILGDLLDAVKNEDGTAVLDLQAAPELESFRTAWTDANGRQDIGGLARAFGMVTKLVNQKVRADAVESIKAAKKETKEARAKTLEELGAHDLDVGTGTPSATEDTSVHGVSRMAKALNKSK